MYQGQIFITSLYYIYQRKDGQLVNICLTSGDEVMIWESESMENVYESCLRFGAIVDETVDIWGYGFEFVDEMEVVGRN